MKGEHIEYGVQYRHHGKWITFEASDDLKIVKGAKDGFEGTCPSVKTRLVLRTVSDWCEMKAKEDCRAMNGAEQDNGGRK